MGEKLEQELSFSELPDYESEFPNIVFRGIRQKTEPTPEYFTDHTITPEANPAKAIYVESYSRTERALFSVCNFVDWSAHTREWSTKQKLAFMQKIAAVREGYASRFIRNQTLEKIGKSIDLPDLTHLGLAKASQFWFDTLTNISEGSTASAFAIQRIEYLGQELERQAKNRQYPNEQRISGAEFCKNLPPQLQSNE